MRKAGTAPSPARRLLAALALPVLIPGCALALGVQNDPTLVAKVICDCPDLAGVPDCPQNLEARLEGADPGVRSAWLQEYATTCSTSCAVRMTCFYTQPACVTPGNLCTDDRECCNYNKKFPDLPICVKNVCK